jgi:hypothetical protein
VVTSLVERVAHRFLVAKSFIPEYAKALQDYEAHGDEKPMKALIHQVCDTILPGGGNIPSPWFNALGTAKRNALKKLVYDGESILKLLDPTHPGYERNPNWRSYVVMQLQAWAKRLRTLEIASEAEDEERVLHRDGFTITPMPGVSKAETDAALEALAEAAGKIRSRFPEVLYGMVYFSTHLGAKTAAHYVGADDTVHLSVRARKRFSDVYTIIHEFGHRYDAKFFKDATLRKEFWSLSTRKEFEKVVFHAALRKQVAEEALAMVKARQNGTKMPTLSNEAMLWFSSSPVTGIDIRKETSAYLAGKLTDEAFITQAMGHKDVEIQTDKLLHGPLAVTPYGATKPTENFAEAFAHHVLGMSMPREFEDLFAKL